MYISSQNTFKLDQIIKSFEVAYRSKIVSSLIGKYPDISTFSVAINNISAKLVDMPIIYSKKFKAKADKIKNEVGNSYNKIAACYSAYVNKDHGNDVLYVSELLDYVNLFFNECFVQLASKFSTIEDFNAQSVKFHAIRNSLAHPASAKVKIRESKDCIEFMLNTMESMEDDMFWYISKEDIINHIAEFSNALEDSVIKVHNLDEISFPQGKIVCRDAEVAQLKEFLFGKDKNYRRSGSVVIFGYGGVGKTALVLEFVSQILKDIGDKKIPSPYDFILFFSSKEEMLSFKQTTGEVIIDNVQKQIGSFDEFNVKLNSELKSGNIASASEAKGLIIIDNFETLSPEDKEKFHLFIRQMPRSVQFILTSRNEEYSEDKINLKEFKDPNKGLLFIDEYIKANDIKLSSYFSPSSKKELVELSKGNTLIIVLTIHQLSISDSINQVLGQLRSVESNNMAIIADFMYKNTIQHTIEELEKENKSPIKVLKVVSLYGEPIDLYSISKLSELSVSEVEKICQILTTRLVFDKIGESYTPNAFANRFILLKYLPNNVEKKHLSDSIRESKKKTKRQLEELDDEKRREPGLKKIMEDWKPKHIIDKIAIAESYSIVGKGNEIIKRSKSVRVSNIHEKMQRLVDDLTKLEKMTSHPYIRMQRARMLMQMYGIEQNANRKQILNTEIIKVYDDALMSILYNYSFIINTKSFASINWKYGLIHANNLGDFEKAARYIEDAAEVLRRIKVFDNEYYRVLNDLSKMYKQLFKNTKDKAYLKEIRLIYQEILNDRENIKVRGFDADWYLDEYGRLLNEPSGRNHRWTKKRKTGGRSFNPNK